MSVARNALRVLVLTLLLTAPATRAFAQDIPPTGAVDTIQVDAADALPKPRDVFVKSLLLPGWGQAEIGAYKRGGVFFALQTTSVYMLLKTIFKLDRARDAEQRVVVFAADSLRQVIAADTAAARRLADPISFENAVFQNRRVLDAQALVHSRTRQRQDWITYLLFFTMLSGVDAYVGAHLQGFPADVSAEARLDGVEMRVSVPVGHR